MFTRLFLYTNLCLLSTSTPFTYERADFGLLPLSDLWPSGSYSLPKPKSGCPDSWREGWLRQDLEDDAISSNTSRSKFSPHFHMNATIVKREYIDRTFCTKVDEGTETLHRRHWQEGMILSQVTTIYHLSFKSS